MRFHFHIPVLMQCKDCDFTADDTSFFKDKYRTLGHIRTRTIYEVRYKCPVCKSFNVSQPHVHSAPVLVVA
jgi:Zn finger protein HypA/HybF involved in hydrogenase expression